MYSLQTSNTIAVALNLLAQNPTVQEKIRKEVDGIDRNESFTLEDVKSMSYIKAFTKEVLRCGRSIFYKFDMSHVMRKPVYAKKSKYSRRKRFVERKTAEAGNLKKKSVTISFFLPGLLISIVIYVFIHINCFGIFSTICCCFIL